MTEDAQIVDGNACQIESRMERSSERSTYWALPACNFTGNLELTVGGAWTREDHGTRNSEVVLQGKSIFKSMDTNGWALGIAAGTLWHPRDHSNHRDYGLYANLPAGISFEDDRIIIHGNLGWNRDNAEQASHLQWGLATEMEIIKPLSLFAEVFGKEQGHPSFQFGFWYWIVPDRVQVNTAYGNCFGTPGGGYWFSVGFSLFSVSFLP